MSSADFPPLPLTRFSDVPDLLAALRRLPADRPALTFYKGRTAVGRLGYGQLLDRIDQLTRRLRDDLGVRPGDCVAVLSPNRLEIPALLLAAMRLGAAVVPLNPTTPPADWDYILAHSQARLIFGVRELLARLIRPPARVCAFEDEPAGPRAEGDAAAADLVPSAPGAQAGNLAIVLYTSGTTGTPKGVALPQWSLLANAWSMAVNFGFRDEIQFAVLPLYHAHALGFGLMTTLTTGGHLVFAERFDPFSWAEILRAESVTVTSVVPTLLSPLLQVGVRRDRVPALRTMLVSSAPLSAALARAFETKTAIPLVQGWGLSEYTNFACCLSPALPDDQRQRLLYGQLGDDQLTSIGGPLPGTEVKVVGPAGQTATAEQRGELHVRGHSTMLAYFRDAGATAEAFAGDGWLRTGDEGFFRLVNGQPVFFITGRIKETIIRDGDKLSPLAIERQILAALPELEGRLVVLGFTHEVHGEEIGVYIEGEEIGDALGARLTKVAGEMPPDSRPKVILHGAAPIPRTHTGKIQRRKLQPTFAPFSACRGALRIERV
jgi:long-chain acyl-CoA synthetase